MIDPILPFACVRSFESRPARRGRRYSQGAHAAAVYASLRLRCGARSGVTPQTHFAHFVRYVQIGAASPVLDARRARRPSAAQQRSRLASRCPSRWSPIDAEGAKTETPHSHAIISCTGNPLSPLDYITRHHAFTVSSTVKPGNIRFDGFGDSLPRSLLSFRSYRGLSPSQCHGPMACSAPSILSR